MVQFVDQAEFTLQKGGGGGQGGGGGGGASVPQGQDPQKHGYPNQWDPPHWHGDDKLNPHLRVYWNEKDGTRCYYDPVKNTWSFEHTSGSHTSFTSDGWIHNVTGKSSIFHGGGGTSETHGGHSDSVSSQGQRENTMGDSYHNTGGVSHAAATGGGVSIHPNQQMVTLNKFKHRIPNDQGAHSVSVGAGSPHESSHTITADRIYSMTMGRQNSDGSPMNGAGAGTLSGDQWTETQQADINHQSGQHYRVQAKQNVSIRALGDHIVLKAGSIVLDGNVLITGMANVQQNVYCADTTNSNKANVNLMRYLSQSTGPAKLPEGSAPGAFTLDSGAVRS